MKKTILTNFAPKPVGPYSQAVLVDGCLYGAGQIGLDPVSGRMVTGGVAEQAEQVLRNIAAVLEAAAMSRDDVVKTTIYLVDLADFAVVNTVYGRFFTAEPPARSTVQVAALPLGGLVEIEFIAVRG